MGAVASEDGVELVEGGADKLVQKASKRHSLDEPVRKRNCLVSRHWMAAEHGIRDMKRYHAVAWIRRDRKPKTDARFNLLAASLWNDFINGLELPRSGFLYSLFHYRSI